MDTWGSKRRSEWVSGDATNNLTMDVILYRVVLLSYDRQEKKEFQRADHEARDSDRDTDSKLALCLRLR
jgi:hypothetical protein